ncbi:hypothetical protein FA13DRAFT_1626524 [Coprinellus micaceus]|uniref:Uncharacterized protein n=1 Tax=Coprinellus micaceus TaxID=71717 RepID=A0A4Y7TJS7_COPMI|nr:hypothetical protein FA13DRAFT_1626524 [Coprinellus micaceus]
MVAEFEKKVGDVGNWANEVDKAFDGVTRTFVQVVNDYGKDFSGLSGFLSEWRGYNSRWVSALLLSRDVASQDVTILRRFEKVFLDMVLHIQTEQDRLDAIVELEDFINEDHDSSDQMSRTFLELKRDIDAFRVRIDSYLKETGTQLDAAAAALEPVIQRLQDEIMVLDKQMNDTRIALAVCGGLLNVIGLIVAGSVLAVYQSQRNAKNNELAGKRQELADINRRQKGLAYLQTDLAGLEPDFDLICERLQGFAEIWASVRSQSVQFRNHIKGGLGAATNLRFKREVQLAQDTCVPLRTGLEIYAHKLDGRLASKGCEIGDTP